MVRRAPAPQTPRHIPIFDEDWEYIERAYGPGSAANLGIGPTIRGVVHVWVKAQKAKEQALVDKAMKEQAPEAKP